jgi:tetratricopeptide (TPR) repeat protein
VNNMNQVMYKGLFLFLLSIMVTPIWSQSNHKNLREGDKSYYQKEYLKAEENYRKALEKNAISVSGNHNLGNSLYNQNRYEEAAKYFESAALQAVDQTEKAMSYHNLGNAYLSQLSGVGNSGQAPELLNKSIDAYKQSLKLNSQDKATKYNLAYAQKLQEQMAQQPQQQPQQNQENEGNPPPKSEENPSPNDESQNQPPEKEQPKPEPQPSSDNNMTKEEAERLIKIMEEEERKVQQRMNKKGKKNNSSGKDW